MHLLFPGHVIEKRLGLANPDTNLNVTFSLLCKLVFLAHVNFYDVTDEPPFLYTIRSIGDSQL